MGKSKWFFSFSGCILLIGALAISGKGINFGIDFDGGTRLTLGLQQHATVDQIRNVLNAAGADRREDPDDLEPAAGPQRGPDHHQAARQAGHRRRRARPRPAFGVRGTPTRRRSARASARAWPDRPSIAIIASLIVITVYIALRFEWKFAVPVLIALMHDVLIMAGVYALPAGR